MTTIYSVLISLVLAFPNLGVNWTSPEESGVTIHVSGFDELLPECVNSSLEMQYRYEIQLCRSRGVWFDSCKEDLTLVRSLAFDEISESYKIKSDLYGDEALPEAFSVSTLEEAIERISRIEDLPLLKLSNQDKEFIKRSGLYLKVRAQSECKGEYSKTVEHAAYFLTLGFLRINGFDSGTMHFSLTK